MLQVGGRTLPQQKKTAANEKTPESNSDSGVIAGNTYLLGNLTSPVAGSMYDGRFPVS
jgi:hypothetical protein